MRTIVIPLVAAVLCLAAGCKSRLVFMTHSSIGLDVSGTAQLPNKVSFSFERYEAAIVPRKANGEAHSVYGGMDADLTFFGGHTIKQTFATGKAAMLATGANTNNVDFPGGQSITNNHPLIFLTATTFGLHLTAGEKEMSPNMLLGYRRSEAAIIPVPEPAQEVRSVYADILINSSANTNANTITTNFSSLRGVRIKQSFATGRAADALALKNQEVRQNLLTAAGLPASAELLKFRVEGADLAAEISDIIDSLPEAKLKDAGQAALDTKLFLNLDEFHGSSAEKQIEQLKTVVKDRRSPRDIEKVKRFKEKLKTLQPD
jgi:hypothetical protein